MTLILDLVRHGEAEPGAMGGDEMRPLSARGLSYISKLAGRLRREGWRPTHALMSPLKRARETAAILRAGLTDAPLAEEVEALAPEAEPEEVLDALKQRGIRSGHVLLVSHQPLIGRLAAHLSGDDASFAPGTLVRITCEGDPGPGRGTVTLTIHPAATP